MVPPVRSLQTPPEHRNTLVVEKGKYKNLENMTFRSVDPRKIRIYLDAEGSVPSHLTTNFFVMFLI